MVDFVSFILATVLLAFIIFLLFFIPLKIHDYIHELKLRKIAKDYYKINKYIKDIEDKNN